MNRSPRYGFTLVEVLVGLVLISITVLTVRSISGQIAAATRAAQVASDRLDRRANLRRWLKAAFLSSDAGPDPGPFDGQRDRVAFQAWLQQPGGWFGRRAIVLEATQDRLIAIVGASDTLLLADSIAAATFAFLLIQGKDTRWVNEWRSTVHTPAAVRVLLDRNSPQQQEGSADTLVFLMKEQG